jgi:aryl-alcohol dehydrogenase-like predicted oxidoreductase
VEYCNLGNSGLEVSRLGLGTITFGTVMNESDSQRTLDMFLASGGNFIDTSNVYGGGFRGTNTQLAGTSEKTLGKLFKGKRDKLVIATKGYWLMEDEITPNSVGLSRTYLTKNINASLQRLGTDYIDLYQCHCWDFYTPIEETMRVLDDFVRAGKVRYIGVSNWDGWQVVKANAYVRSANLTPVISNQIYYNVVDRAAETSIIPACDDQSVSVIAWGALAEGFLTGSYQRGVESPLRGSCFDGEEMKEGESTSWRYLATERNWTIIELLARLADAPERTIPNVAIRWLLQNGSCDVVLLGGDNPEHYEVNLRASDFRLTGQEMEELTQMSKPAPVYPGNFHNLFCRRESRFWGGLR